MLVKQAPLQKIVRSMHAGFSALTTGLLHWLTGPYVHALEYTPATQRLRIRTLSVLCQAVHTDVHLREVRAPESSPAVLPGHASAVPASVHASVHLRAVGVAESCPCDFPRPYEHSRARACAWCIPWQNSVLRVKVTVAPCLHAGLQACLTSCAGSWSPEQCGQPDV